MAVRPGAIVNPLEALMRMARDGRGCWIGLFASNGPTLEIGPWKTSEYHVTVAHLGRARDRSEQWMSNAVAATREAASNVFAIETKIHATARFRGGRDGDPMVYLLKGDNLMSMHACVMRHLNHYDITYDDRFGFLPHITIGRMPHNSMIAFSHPVDTAIAFDTLKIVCGDTSIPFALQPPPF
jgi:2'-5' RNA ligase